MNKRKNTGQLLIGSYSSLANMCCYFFVPKISIFGAHLFLLNLCIFYTLILI